MQKILQKNFAEATMEDYRTLKKSAALYIALIIITMLMGCAVQGDIQANHPEENFGAKPPTGTETLLAWVDYGGGREDAKAIVGKRDGVGVVLRDKPQPIDIDVEPETLYLATKSEDLPGYNLFTITPGMQTPDSPKTIEIDYIGMRKEGNRSFLGVVYKTNKGFDFDIGLAYTIDPKIGEAYPVNSPDIEVNPRVGAKETKELQSASVEINQAMLDEFAKIDLAINYLEKLDQEWRTGDQRFFWEGNKISTDYARQIGESMKSRFGVPNTRLLTYGDRMIEASYGAPVISHGIIVVTENNEQMEGDISIAFS